MFPIDTGGGLLGGGSDPGSIISGIGGTLTGSLNPILSIINAAKSLVGGSSTGTTTTGTGGSSTGSVTACELLDPLTWSVSGCLARFVVLVLGLILIVMGLVFLKPSVANAPVSSAKTAAAGAIKDAFKAAPAAAA